MVTFAIVAICEWVNVAASTADEWEIQATAQPAGLWPGRGSEQSEGAAEQGQHRERPPQGAGRQRAAWPSPTRAAA